MPTRLRIVFTAVTLLVAGTAGAAGAAPLSVDFLDVGQGDAALIVSPTGKAVLIDAGPRGSGKIVRAAMRRRGVQRLDLVLISHAHADHVGGVLELLDQVPIGRYLDPGLPHTSALYRRTLEALARKGVPMHTARAGQTIRLGGGAVLRLLAPSLPLFHGTRSDLNACSVVARLEYGAVSVLFTGDAEQPTEARLRQRHDLRSTVLKVAHHGSRYASTPAFLARVKPRIAVISVGKNGYGHPAAQTLRRLAVIGAEIYRTDLDGTVSITTDGRKLTVSTERTGRKAEAGSQRPHVEAGRVSPTPALDGLRLPPAREAAVP